MEYIIAAVIAGIFGLVTAAANRNSQVQTNLSNQQWTEQQNEITREREDNALQRAKADAIAAGFSPLAAMGSPAGSSSGLHYQGTAPQIDLSSTLGNITTALSGHAQDKQQTKALKAQKSKDRLDFMLNTARFWNEVRKDRKNNEILEEQLKGLQEDTKQKKIDTEIKEHDRDIIIKNPYLKSTDSGTPAQVANAAGVFIDKMSGKVSKEAAEYAFNKFKSHIEKQGLTFDESKLYKIYPDRSNSNYVIVSYNGINYKIKIDGKNKGDVSK